MIKAVNCAALSTALEKLKNIVKENEEKRKKTVIFCEDRLSLAAERTVCAAVGGTFLTSVYTFARFLSSEAGKTENVLSAQGSAMAVRRIIEEHKNELKLLKSCLRRARRSRFTILLRCCTLREFPQRTCKKRRKAAEYLAVSSTTLQ